MLIRPENMDTFCDMETPLRRLARRVITITTTTTRKSFPIKSTGCPLPSKGFPESDSLATHFHLPQRPLSEEAEDESDCFEDQAADDDEEEHVCWRSRLAGLLQGSSLSPLIVLSPPASSIPSLQTERYISAKLSNLFPSNPPPVAHPPLLSRPLRTRHSHH